MTTQVQPSSVPFAGRATIPVLRHPVVRYAGGVLALAAAYFVAAKIGQTLRYTASVSAIWPPAGLGIAALYLWGTRWWPGVFLGELVVNVDLLDALPAGSLIGQQTGNMAEILIGAMLLRRLCGPRAALDRVDQVAAVFAVAAVAAAISATFGTISMLAGGVIESREALSFWRTWTLGDSSGVLVVVAVALAWSHSPGAAWRQLRTLNGTLMVSTVVVLGVVSVTVEDPVTYAVFPALIWAAFRFGPPGATLAVAITAAVAIGLTAADVGPFSKQPINHQTIGTQLYIAVAALTTLILAAVVAERARSAAALTAARLREGERALEDRRRLARDLHDSVSQALFSTVLHTRRAQRALGEADGRGASALRHSLDAIGEVTRDAQTEMRSIIGQLGRDPLLGGLRPALARLAAEASERDGVTARLTAQDGELGLSEHAEGHLFYIAREAVANAVKHADTDAVDLRLARHFEEVTLEVADRGRGFDVATAPPGHFGLDSMRSRAHEIDGRIAIDSGPGNGTVVRVVVPVGEDARHD
jgi:signal transduction histidine kinase